MITFYKPKGETGAWEGYGMSTDVKPTDDTIPNGTALFIMDEGQLFAYDKAAREWKVQ